MKTKHIIIGVVAVAVCLLLIGFGLRKSKTNSGSGSQESTSVNDTKDKKTESKDSKETASEATTKAKKQSETEATTAASDTSDDTDVTEADSKDTGDSSQAESNPSSEEETTEKAKSIDIPYKVGDTGLKITKISGYDGLFLEDGSDTEKDDITAIKVKNNSGKNVEYGTITLEADGMNLVFDFSDLPDDASIVVMEKDATTYDSDWNLQYVDGQVAYMDSFSMMEDQVSLSVNDNDSITVKNVSGSTIPEIRLFYKYKLKSGEYVGGITYTAKIGKLKSGESTTISPSHFTKKGSKIMMVRTYDEATE